MILNIILGFIIPWIFGTVLYFKNKRIVLIIAPFSSILAYTVNEFCFHLNFWRLAPLNIQDDYTSTSVNLGLYPILGCCLIYCIWRNRINPYLIVFIFALGTTTFEYAGFLLKLVTYGNGWNIGWSFISYFIPYLLLCLYYLKLKAIKVF
ncbi:CBO0543 family protein [Clostridium sp. WILCCON 0269]|uniref:CBO0543 family protein n=1 Tax=Candidatus Clostridium eludens TaxID=3381663 RepID=A0ABW8SH57_9CLOT